MAAVDVLSGLLSGGGQLAAAYFPYAATEEQMNAIKDIASTFAGKAGEIGTTAAEAAAFKPFAVKTATGTTEIGQGGALEQTLAQQPAAIQQGLLGQAQTMSGMAPLTATDLYAQMQAAQAPELERQRLALENRLQAQGRGGVTTAAYGGTPEQLAFEKALQEQSTKNLLAAQQLAPTLQGQQLQNIQSALTGAYLPQAQELAALTPAAQLANIATSAGLGQAESLYKSGISGLQAESEATGAVAGLEAARAKALASALQGLFATGSSGQASPVDQLITSLLGTGSSSSSSSGDGLFNSLFSLFGSGSSSTNTDFNADDWADDPEALSWLADALG
jgi:hypothetical protein